MMRGWQRRPEVVVANLELEGLVCGGLVPSIDGQEQMMAGVGTKISLVVS